MLELLATILTVGLGASLWLWRKEATQVADLTQQLIGARLVAAAGTHTTKVLSARIKERNEQIEQLVELVADKIGPHGLVDILNSGLLPDGEGGDDPEGLPN